MGPEKIYQVIFCSETKGRAFLREITFTHRAAMVTNVEKLPPGYECAIETMREVNERVLHFRTTLDMKPGCDRCPFCNNAGVFICPCGALSCIGSDKNVHACPVHGGIYNTKPTDEFDASPSGLPPGGLAGLASWRRGDSIFSLGRAGAPAPPPFPRLQPFDEAEERSPAQRGEQARRDPRNPLYLPPAPQARREQPDLWPLLPSAQPPGQKRITAGPPPLPQEPRRPLLLPPAAGDGQGAKAPPSPAPEANLSDIWNSSRNPVAPEKPSSRKGDEGSSGDARDRLRRFLDGK